MRAHTTHVTAREVGQLDLAAPGPHHAVKAGEGGRRRRRAGREEAVLCGDREGGGEHLRERERERGGESEEATVDGVDGEA